MLYLSYGSNLNIRQMTSRCPTAEPVDKFYLRNKILRFRGVADMVNRQKCQCPAGLWNITRRDVKTLDRYEGVSTGLYNKKWLLLQINGREREVLYYQMRRGGIMPPSEGYFESILQGYEDFGLDTEYLERALQHSWERKNRTPLLTRRYFRKGRPPLARIWEEEMEQEPDQDVAELAPETDWKFPDEVDEEEAA